MANEITLNVSMRVLNGAMLEQIQPGTISIDQAAVGGPSPGYVTIGTSEESVTLSELSTLGYCFIQNLGPTNYVEWGFATTVYGGRLKAGEIAVFRFNPGAALFMKANTAACKVIVKAFEN
jgi:hypothetical protein